MIFSKNLSNGTKFGVHRNHHKQRIFGMGVEAVPRVARASISELTPLRIRDLELVKRTLKIMDNDPQNFY